MVSASGCKAGPAEAGHDLCAVRIALVSPPLLPVPPVRYGGVERIVGVLADELHARGHDVTVFAPGDSSVRGRLVPTVPYGLWEDGFYPDPSEFYTATRAAVLARASEFDLIHNHMDHHGFELARQLLEHGANPNVRIDWDEIKFEPLGGTTRNPPGLFLGRHLLTYNGATAFYVAAKNGDHEYMRLLAKAGADPTLPNRFGVTPLMVAAGLDTWEGETPGPHTGMPEADRLKAVELAVELGNDINAAADFGDFKMDGDPEYTLLYYPHNLRELQELGVGDPRWSGSTALHGSIIANQPSITQYLVDHGANLDAKTKTGWTALMMTRGVFLANTGRMFPAAEAILLKALAERDARTASN